MERIYKDYDFDPEYDVLYTVDEWEHPHNIRCSDWGSGYWVKDGKRSEDEVFGTPRLDATHVVWYNK